MLKEKSQNEQDMSQFVWREKRVKVNNSFEQKEIKLVDATPEQLKSYYTYCDTMLNNESKEYPGRNVVLKLIQEQRDKCNTELFLRLAETSEPKITRYELYKQIQAYVSDSEYSIKELVFGDVTSNCPSEFKEIPLSLIVNGCLDCLGAFERKHLTLAFILKQGIWFTPQEMEDLNELDEQGQQRNRLDVVRERLNIDKNIIFNINDKGLSYLQLRSMLQLKNKKYSELTTDQLTLLRNRILFNLETEVKHHIKQWKKRKEQIQLVADSREISL